MTAVINLAGPASAAGSDAFLQRLAHLSAELGKSLGVKISEVRRICGLIPSATSVEEALASLVKTHNVGTVLDGTQAAEGVLCDARHAGRNLVAAAAGAH